MALPLALLLVVAGAGLSLYGLGAAGRRPIPADDAAEYLRSLDWEPEETDEFQQLLAQPFLSRVVRPIAGGVLDLLGGILPRNYRDSVHLRLLYAGLSSQFRAEEIISLQALGGIVGFLLAVLLSATHVLSGGVAILALALLPLAGAQLPRSWLDRKVEDRRDSIRRDLPDTLDLLAISVEAGMGFEGALGIVCDNFASPLADEFARTLREMELGLPRREALQNLRRRTEVPELSNFVLTLMQADALGMPVGRVLKVSAEEMRTKRQQWAREKAAKLPVKILFPLVLFIFPAIFVVLLGPAASDIGGALGLTAGEGLPTDTPADSLAPFGQAILAIRWGTTAVALAVASPELRSGDARLLTFAAVVVAYTTYRTIRPLRYGDETAGLLQVLAEVAVTVVGVTATGYWDSPLAFSLLTAVSVAGFARGFGFGIRVGLASILAVAIPWSFEPSYGEDALRTSVQWAVEILLVALVAGYARRISGEADQRQILALDRLGRLADANTLLYQLHQVTQTLPASLDLDEVLDTTMAQVRELFRFDSVALLLFDDTDLRWHTARREGGRPPGSMDAASLPRPLAHAVRLRSLVSEQNLLASGGPGLNPSSSSGLYSVLSARGSIIGIISIEHGEAHHFTPRDVELLSGFVEPAALAIDNARWFGRLRTVGADEERTRIARDLHDRIGQSLAYLAFELDRIVKSRASGQESTDALDNLRADVRGVIGEVRDTLYDLRTDVTESQSLSSTLEAFLERVKDRSAIEAHLRAQETGRLPILQERELWRIAQEAVTNVERHAHAHQITISWRCDGRSARLEIADDGIGFPVGRAGRLDSYGLLGMRERAASIGATLEVDSEPGRGTRVRCTLEDAR